MSLNYNRKVLKYGSIVKASSKVIANVTPHIKVDRVVRVLPVKLLKDYAIDVVELEAKGIPFWRIADILGMSPSYARKIFKDFLTKNAWDPFD